MINLIESFLNKRLRKKLIERLNKIDKSEWKRIEHDFNDWTFPKDFEDLKPKWWDNGGKRIRERKYETTAIICTLVYEEFGERKMLEYHNVTVGDMTLDEFNEWYEKKIKQWGKRK